MSTSAASTRSTVDYPESDGQPLAETDIHQDELIALRGTLRELYRERDDVYVGANMFFYFEEGEPSSCFAPDVFVVFGVPSQPPRRTYKLWVELVAPALVVEISSRKTWLEDAGNKKAICERLGVLEYLLFDPEADYLDPPLQLYRLTPSGYQRVLAPRTGRVPSHALGLELELDAEHRLHLVDPSTGQRLPRPDELAALRRAAEARADAAEAEVARLQAELERLRSG